MRPSWFELIKIFLVKVMEYNGKKRVVDFTYRYSLDVANNTIFPLSKMIESLKIKSCIRKTFLTDLMKEMLATC